VKRRTFDILAAVGGLFLAVTLIVSGVLLAWAHDFIGNEVHTQLAAQKIYFPPAGSAAIKAPEFAAMRQYAGQQLTTGAQAETYADHFIANHLIKIGGGKTYAQVSAEALASPGNAKLAATDLVPGPDAARPAAQRLRLRDHGHDRRNRRHRRVHRGRGHADTQRPWPYPRPPRLPLGRHPHPAFQPSGRPGRVGHRGAAAWPQVTRLRESPPDAG